MKTELENISKYSYSLVNSFVYEASRHNEVLKQYLGMAPTEDADKLLELLICHMEEYLKPVTDTFTHDFISSKSKLPRTSAASQQNVCDTEIPRLKQLIERLNLEIDLNRSAYLTSLSKLDESIIYKGTIG